MEPPGPDSSMHEVLKFQWMQFELLLKDQKFLQERDEVNLEKKIDYTIERANKGIWFVEMLETY